MYVLCACILHLCEYFFYVFAYGMRFMCESGRMCAFAGSVGKQYLHIHTYIHTSTHICITTHTHITTYIRIHTYIHTYIHTHKSKSQVLVESVGKMVADNQALREDAVAMREKLEASLYELKQAKEEKKRLESLVEEKEMSIDTKQTEKGEVRCA